MTGVFYLDAFNYVKEIAPLLIVLGALSFADILITTLVELVRKSKKSIKW